MYSPCMTSSWACCKFLVFHCHRHLHSASYQSQLLNMLLSRCSSTINQNQNSNQEINMIEEYKKQRLQTFKKFLKNCLQFCKRKKKKEFKNFLIKTRNIFVECYIHIVILISPCMAKAISNEQVIFCCCYRTRNKLTNYYTSNLSQLDLL